MKDHANTQNKKVRQNFGMLCGAVGIVCNIILFVIEIIAGVCASSVSIIADAMHDLSDVISSIIMVVAFKFAGKPADCKHPFGYGRVEYVCGLFVSFLIMVMGLEFARWSVLKIMNVEPMELSLTTIFILVASVIIKAWVACFFHKIGKKTNSEAIRANFKESVADTAATITVLLGILLTLFLKISLDGYIGIVVSCFIIYTGFSSMKDTLNPILGQAPDMAFVKALKQKVLLYDGISGVHDVIVHSYGPGRTLVSLHAEVARDANLREIHDTIDSIERAIKEELFCEIVIHIDPIATNDKDTNKAKMQTKDAALQIDPRITVHDFRTKLAEEKINLLFDLVLPPDFPLPDEEVISKMQKQMQQIDSRYFCIANIEIELTE